MVYDLHILSLDGNLQNSFSSLRWFDHLYGGKYIINLGENALAFADVRLCSVKRCNYKSGSLLA